MGLFLTPNQKIFTESFNRYGTLYEEFKELYDDVMPKSFRLFDIRYRITLGVVPNFDNAFGNAMTDSVKNTYKLIIKINDAWFAFEALFKLLVEEEILKPTALITNPIPDEMIRELHLEESMDLLNKYLIKHLVMHSRRKIDLMNLIEYLKEDKKQALHSALTNARLCVDQNKPLGIKEILSVIYSLRVNYMHNGDTARSGVQFYSTKIHLLRPCYDFLIILCIKLASHVLEKKIKEIDAEDN